MRVISKANLVMLGEKVVRCLLGIILKRPP